jgi:DNA-binding transcriptional ArsR family regulator
MTTSRNENLSSGQLAGVARLFAVLSEASRLTLLQALKDGPLSVTDLIKKCKMKQANVSKHLAVLHDHRLVRRERMGTSILYEIADPTVFQLCSLVCGKIKGDAKKTAAMFSPEI